MKAVGILLLFPPFEFIFTIAHDNQRRRAPSGLKRLRSKMDPSNVNGGVLLGLNGVVVKSHGGTDAEGYATAVQLAADLAGSRYMEEVAAGLRRDSGEVSVSEASE